MSDSNRTIGFRRTLIRGPFDRDYGKSASVREEVHELHATKGWRLVQVRSGTTSIRSVPALEVTFKRTRGESRGRFQIQTVTTNRRTTMDHATAKAIATEYAPQLIIDDHNTDIASVLIVRKVEGGMPFSIHLPSTLPGQFQEIPAMPAIEEQPAIEASDDHPGHPAIPAQPARPGRTIAGQIAESEKKMLTDALDSAIKTLGV